MSKIQFYKNSTAIYTDFQLEYFLIVRNILYTKGLLAHLTWNTSKDTDYKYHLGNELGGNITRSVRQGSLPSPVLFNIFPMTRMIEYQVRLLSLPMTSGGRNSRYLGE